MNVLDLFSGIGGFSLGLEAVGMHTSAFCECDPYAQAVLRKHWPDTPIHPDIKELDASRYAGTVELVCGGYPCQPFSVAGKRKAEADERHLWPEMLRVIRRVRPRWVIAENVAGHIELGFDEVAASLEAEGFAVWPFVIPACAVDAPHRRDRIWIISYHPRDRRGEGWEGRFDSGDPWEPQQALQNMAYAEINGGRAGFCEDGKIENRFIIGNGSAPLADTNGERRCLWETNGENAENAGQSSRCEEIRQWFSEPNVGRVAHGIPNRVDRLRCLGNAIVPQIAEIIGQAIMTMEAAA